MGGAAASGFRGNHPYRTTPPLEELTQGPSRRSRSLRPGPCVGGALRAPERDGEHADHLPAALDSAEGDPHGDTPALAVVEDDLDRASVAAGERLGELHPRAPPVARLDRVQVPLPAHVAEELDGGA